MNLYKVKKNKNLNLKQKETNNLTVIHYNLEPLDNLIKIQTFLGQKEQIMNQFKNQLTLKKIFVLDNQIHLLNQMFFSIIKKYRRIM